MQALLNLRCFVLQPRKVRFTLPPQDGAGSPEIESENFGTFPPRISARSGGIFNVNTEKPLSQRPSATRTVLKSAAQEGRGEKFSLTRRFEKFRKDRLQNYRQDFGEKVEVPVSVSPGEFVCVRFHLFYDKSKVFYLFIFF